MVMLVFALLTGCDTTVDALEEAPDNQATSEIAAYKHSSDPLTFDLYAGQKTFVGEVVVSPGTAAGTIDVTYNLVDGWCTQLVHLHVGLQESDFPLKNGNPSPGQFAYSESFSECTDTAVIEGIQLPTLDGVVLVAAHAEVSKGEVQEPGESAQCGFLYGIEHVTGALWQVDPVDGTSQLIYNTGLVGHTASWPNALATDLVNEVLYYTNRPSFAASDFYSYDFTSQTLVDDDFTYVADGGEAPLINAGAIIFDGKYWTIPHGFGTAWSDDDLISVDPATGNATVVIPDFTGAANKNYEFGDLAAGEEGGEQIVYFFGSYIAGGTEIVEFAKINLATGVYTQISTGYAQKFQIAFGADGNLWAHATFDGDSSDGVDDGEWFIVNTADGSLSNQTPSVNGLLFNDISPAFQNCGEGEEETAWGAVDVGQIPFPGNNWATYFTFHTDDLNP